MEHLTVTQRKWTGKRVNVQRTDLNGGGGMSGMVEEVIPLDVYGNYEIVFDYGMSIVVNEDEGDKVIVQ